MRFLEIDLKKGFAVIFMVIFHVYYLGEHMNKININTSTGLLHFMARFAHTTFIICMGINLVLTYQANKKKGKSKKEFNNKIIKRFIIFILISCLISYTSYLAFGKTMFIKFGIFHFMAFASLITSLFVDKPVLSMFSILIINILTFLIKSNIISINNINSYIGFALGINTNYSSLDHFPLIPWLSYSLLGVFIGNKLYTNYERNFEELNLDNTINNSDILKIISMSGSKSLEVYLIHFPIIYFLLK